MPSALRTGDPRWTPLFWLHGMLDGSGGYMDDVVRALDPRQPVWILHPAGFDGTPFPNDIRKLAARHLADIRTIRPSGPYHIGGFCNGAVVALEIAQSLVANGETVASVTLVSPPAWSDALPAFVAASSVLARALRLDDEQRVSLLLHLCSYRERIEQFLSGDIEEKWAGVRAAVRTARRKFAGAGSRDDAPGALSEPDSLQCRYDRYVAAISQYVPAAYPGPIDVIWGREIAEGRADRTGGWRSRARPARSHYVEGGHFCALESPEEVGSLLCRILGTERITTVA